ncbi:hypothetical protein BN946_scf184459.g1, partial [Trametes cinnabarina]
VYPSHGLRERQSRLLAWIGSQRTIQGRGYRALSPGSCDSQHSVRPSLGPAIRRLDKERHQELQQRGPDYHDLLSEHGSSRDYPYHQANKRSVSRLLLRQS